MKDIYQTVEMLLNDAMYLTCHHIRRINLLTLFKDSGLKKSDFAIKIGVSPSYFSQLFSADDNKRRNIGDDFARAIERVCEKPEGWLDNRHEDVFDQESDPIPAKVIATMLAVKKYIAESKQSLTNEEIERLYRAAINAGLELDVESNKINEYLKFFLPKK
jgi:transcriptional regulator with XRE-family HTH domain